MYFFRFFLLLKICNIDFFNVTGEAKHNIDELVDDLKHAVKLDTSQDECPNIIQILDSMVNVSKTSIEGTMRKLRYILNCIIIDLDT